LRDSRDHELKRILSAKKIPTKTKETAIPTDSQIAMQEHKKYEKLRQYDSSKS
jgi:hypothetical protein